ncbi:MAG: hypothetical protein DRP66_03520 [Planctomycetota bacterium]|nr:MAG: hypothetical protein DRP66_03520 [Planctomycetota bacterium]
MEKACLLIIKSAIRLYSACHRQHNCTKVPVPGGKIFVFCPIIDRLTAQEAGDATFFEKS